jgi:hypothetical protein
MTTAMLEQEVELFATCPHGRAVLPVRLKQGFLAQSAIQLSRNGSAAAAACHVLGVRAGIADWQRLADRALFTFGPRRWAQ